MDPRSGKRVVVCVKGTSTDTEQRAHGKATVLTSRIWTSRKGEEEEETKGRMKQEIYTGKGKERKKETK
jgi:hypothetical protein